MITFKKKGPYLAMLKNYSIGASSMVKPTKTMNKHTELQINNTFTQVHVYTISVITSTGII